jgi:hypothetical protein
VEKEQALAAQEPDIVLNEPAFASRERACFEKGRAHLQNERACFEKGLALFPRGARYATFGQGFWRGMGVLGRARSPEDPVRRTGPPKTRPPREFTSWGGWGSMLGRRNGQMVKGPNGQRKTEGKDIRRSDFFVFIWPFGNLTIWQF